MDKNEPKMSQKWAKIKPNMSQKWAKAETKLSQSWVNDKTEILNEYFLFSFCIQIMKMSGEKKNLLMKLIMFWEDVIGINPKLALIEQMTPVLIFFNEFLVNVTKSLAKSPS